jgi:dipeptidase D
MSIEKGGDNMKAIEGLLPEDLWRYFWEISQIPRESGKERLVCEYIISVADKLGLKHRIDSTGNVLVLKPGVPDVETIAIQSHMDMVCEKDSNTEHDFDTDPIRLVRDGQWMCADGTTLGADNGIGMAAMLAIMGNSSLIHPNLEIVFTVEEETGLTGASMLTEEFLSGKTLINLDSEEDGIFYIGCAGGRDTDISFKLSFTQIPDGLVPVRIRITGLKGGHSGIDIHKGRGNAIKLLTRVLKGIKESIPYYLSTIDGGAKHNVIPREAEALIVLKEQHIAQLSDALSQWEETFFQELRRIDDQVKILVLDDVTAPQTVIDPDDAEKILTMISILPHGVLNMNNSIDNPVVTSTNLAICSIKNNMLEVGTNQRSIYTTSIQDVSDMVKSIGWVLGTEVTQHHDYPAWKPNLDSAILKMAQGTFEFLYKKTPRIQVIHAGLECGVISERLPDIDMISFGPTVEQAHSPSERVNIDTVQSMWKLLTTLLERLTAT